MEIVVTVTMPKKIAKKPAGHHKTKGKDVGALGSMGGQKRKHDPCGDWMGLKESACFKGMLAVGTTSLELDVEVDLGRGNRVAHKARLEEVLVRHPGTWGLLRFCPGGPSEAKVGENT